MMNNWYWTTDEEHSDNSETMSDYLNVEMDQSWEVLLVDGTYAEVLTDCGEKYAVHASGNGDFRNHMVSFDRLNNE